MVSSISAIDLSLAAFGLYLLKRLLEPKQPAPYPPGPKGLPVIGNVHQFPKEQEWKTFYQWSEQYGDMTMVNLLGQRMLIINSAKVAVELLDKKSSIYSDRPVMEMCAELVGWKQALALVPYGERFRDLRRLMHGALAGKANLAEHRPIQELETHKFLLRALKDSSRLQEEIRSLAGGIILKVSHGYEVNHDGHDPVVSLIERTMDEFAQISTPGAYLVDVLPALKYLPEWFPGAGFKKDAKEMKSRLHAAIDAPHQFVKDQMAAGTELPSYTSRHLEAGDITPHTEDLIKFGAFAIYGGGADTAEYSFYLAMTLNPEIQKRAQAEIDAVVGTDRLPTLADRDHLPYVDALVKEVFRWNPVAPQGIPHSLREDDIHDGYFIPKGTVCIANIWKFLHDPKTYSNPMAFDPSRFIDAPGKPAEEDPRHFCFGFGRRICPGLQLADQSVWLACAMALAAFDISKAKDEHGHVLEPTQEYTSGLISHPKQFPCALKPRSTRAEALIRSVEEYR
ncbi:cytochrome P450 [Punctularia strigosozonata HHB-11173 SS5]|uniref:cytochrome P450 n=1 Tax=Punctularia strigosozonata (strain HHB-11173) TaxID=741275 RepID=UPI00044178BF|nr:cytochrome P450 [Punctularia strigosozonata HHB-11173 SS5]EIN08237.1 cytochrome P450 [Punctularia strigosozonata HHB-11173 SS5]